MLEVIKIAKLQEIRHESPLLSPACLTLPELASIQQTRVGQLNKDGFRALRYD